MYHIMLAPPFPTDVSRIAKALHAKFVRFESNGAEAHPYRFRTAVPRHWKPQPLGQETPGGPKPLARLGTTGDRSVEVHVDLIEVDRDVNPSDWLENGYAAAGAEILHRRDALGPQGKVSDLLVRCAHDHGAAICRGTIVKDGPRMFRIEARAAESAYAEWAEALLLCLASFELLNPLGDPTAEPVIEETSDGPAPFSFRRLNSWQILESVHGEPGQLLQLASHHEGAALGRITIEVCKKAPERQLERLARKYAERLKAEGIRLSGAAVIPTEPPGDFRAAAVFAPLATCTGHSFDSPVLLFEHDEALVLLALLGPTRGESPEWWAINKRAFEIVRDSLRIGPSEPVRDPRWHAADARPPDPQPPARPKFPDAGSY